MKQIALVGVSGVGKSTYLKRCAETLSFLHLEASSLIKEQKQLIEGTFTTSEQLRTGAVLNNQELLISAYKRRTNSEEQLCVLDGHTVIDTGRGFQKIPANVFHEMNIEKFIVLVAEAAVIKKRREMDTERKRPIRSVTDIRDYQELVKSYTTEIGKTLGIPVVIIKQNAPVDIIRI